MSQVPSTQKRGPVGLSQTGISNGLIDMGIEQGNTRKSAANLWDAQSMSQYSSEFNSGVRSSM